jgi:hypothetical protein
MDDAARQPELATWSCPATPVPNLSKSAESISVPCTTARANDDRRQVHPTSAADFPAGIGENSAVAGPFAREGRPAQGNAGSIVVQRLQALPGIRERGWVEPFAQQGGRCCA